MPLPPPSPRSIVRTQPVIPRGAVTVWRRACAPGRVRALITRRVRARRGLGKSVRAWNKLLEWPPSGGRIERKDHGMSSMPWLERLKALVGAEHVISDPGAMSPYITELRGLQKGPCRRHCPARRYRHRCRGHALRRRRRRAGGGPGGHTGLSVAACPLAAS